MYPIAYLNGNYVKLEDAYLPVTDLAVIRGYAIFDYFRYLEREPIFLGDHLDRSSSPGPSVCTWSPP